MALTEPILSNSAPTTPGQLYCANTGPNGSIVPVICPNGVTTVAALKTALSATVIKQIDMQSRVGGVFLDTSAVTGRDIFET
jgi:hypothetical protein